MVKIAGCAGHAGFGVTPGKRSPNGEFEWDFNNKVILAFEETLKQYENVEFLRTDDRTGRTDVSLATRTNKANSWGADVYISFHHNGNTGQWGTWTGTETFAWGSGKSLEIGKLVHTAVLNAYGLRDRGLKNGQDLYIIKNTNCPAVLVEGGFHDSTIDILKLRDDNVLRNAGTNVAHAVASYFGLKKRIVTQPTQTVQTQVSFQTVSNSEFVGKTLTVKVDGLWFYNSPRWDVKGGESNKGNKFFITEELVVNGFRMFKCHDGKYRTADYKYVDIDPRPSDYPYQVVIDNITHKQAQEIVILIGSQYKAASVVGVAKE